MKKHSSHRGLKVVLLLTAACVAGVALYAFLPTRTPELASVPEPVDQQMIDRGRYIATASDCIACHTARDTSPDNQPFAGGLAMATPFGDVYSTNITPDKQTGIGNYTLADFDRAVRHGILPNGDSLYPAMPYPSYARLTDEDVTALYTYFMHDVQPVSRANQDADIPWPLSMRWPLAIWRKTFGPGDDERGFDPSKYGDARIARGAYLVQGMGHCGACHTPRDAFQRERGLDESSPDFLSGGSLIDGWVTTNLRGDEGDGLGRWSEQDIVALLRTGRSPHGAVSGEPMRDVIEHSTQHLTDDDLGAMAAYIKTLSPAGGERGSYTPVPDTAQALKEGQRIGLGADLYVDNCAACHRTDGKGDEHAFPALAGNTTVLSRDPSSVIRLILGGEQMPVTETRPSPLAMPGFAWRLDDDEVAALATFIRNGWGNRAPEVSAAQVKGVRDDMAGSHEAHRLTRTAPWEND